MNKLFLTLSIGGGIIVAGLIVTGIVLTTQSSTPIQTTQTTQVALKPAIDINEVVLWKTATCGCCVKYTAYLEENGYKVRIEEVDSLDGLHEEYNIPQEMASCHIAFWNDYYSVGHIPLSAVEKMMSEQTQIDGIALPGMPSGSPGMPGQKNEDWNIFQVVDGKTNSFVVI